MKGYPKMLNSKDDYEFVRNKFPREEWQEDFKSLLETQKEWFNTGAIEENNKGIEDETHRVVIDKQSGIRYQYELKEDPNCKLTQLRYTADEVNRILDD